MPLSGCSWTKRARISVRTGISRAAQSIRSWPCAARSRSLTSLPLVLTFKSLVISSIHDLADHFDAVKELSPAQVLELDEDLHADHLATELANQPDPGGCRAARRQYIIDDQDLLAGLHRVRVHLELIGAVFELIGVGDRRPGQLSGLADRDEPGIELDRNRRARDETTGLDRRHQVRRRFGPPLRHHVDDLAEELLPSEQGRDVSEDDAWLGETGNVPHVLLQLLGRGHTTDRKYSRVRVRPSSRATSGSQPSSVRACAMSGRRCFGSSTGRSR